MATDQWTIRNLLTPVATRLLIGGGNPFDLEEVLGRMESVVLRNAKQLEDLWLSSWDEKARFYESLAVKARNDNNLITSLEMYRHATLSRFAAFLINTSSPEKKKESYLQYRDTYAESIDKPSFPVVPVDIPLDGEAALAAYLHLPPAGRAAAGAIVLFSGLGSCKEEMHTLARPLAERGIAVLVPDMPGCGVSLFERGIQCRIEHIEAAFSSCLHFLTEHEAVANVPVGCAGLCMGGGYAYRAASLNRGYRYCAVLFPLFVADVPISMIPQWFKAGDWFTYQTGYTNPTEFESVMGCAEKEHPECPFFIAHGKHDNWMSLERTRELFSRVPNDDKELLVIENDSDRHGEYSAVLHTMPVGEQLHWVKHRFADWLHRQASTGTGR